MDKIRIKEYFADVETVKEHNGYFCSVGEALTVVLLGTLCGLKNVSQISQWAEHERVKGLLGTCFQYRKNTVLLLDAVPAETNKHQFIKPLPYEMGADTTA